MERVLNLLCHRSILATSEYNVVLTIFSTCLPRTTRSWRGNRKGTGTLSSGSGGSSTPAHWLATNWMGGRVRCIQPKKTTPVLCLRSFNAKMHQGSLSKSGESPSHFDIFIPLQKLSPISTTSKGQSVTFDALQFISCG